MKHLIITLSIALSSTSALAQADCSFMTDSIFVCYFDGTSGLELFENLDESQIKATIAIEDGGVMTTVSQPSLIGYDLDINNCVSEAFDNEAKTTCILNGSADKSAFSTARPVPQKTVIKRMDVR